MTATTWLAGFAFGFSLLAIVVLSFLLIKIRPQGSFKAPRTSTLRLLKITAVFDLVLWKLVLPSIFGIAIFAVALWIFSKASPTSAGNTNDYEFFRDVIAIVLSAAGLLIAIFGTMAFFLLRSLLSQYVIEEIGEGLRRLNVRTAGLLGYSLGMQFEHSSEEYLLDLAIEVHRRTDVYARELDENIRESEEAICLFRNNWAYDLASLKNPNDGDEELAYLFVDYLKERMLRFPEHAPVWTRTIESVNKKFAGKYRPYEQTSEFQ